jgi:hypothetical protein
VKRAGILSLAIVLVLGLTVGASHAAKPKKVASEVDIDGYDFQPPSFEFTFIGNVYSKKPKCVRNRVVTVFDTDGGQAEPVGTTTTDHTGDWRLDPDPLTPGNYQAQVARKRVGKPGKRLVCKVDTSPTFFLAP